MTVMFLPVARTVVEGGRRIWMTTAGHEKGVEAGAQAREERVQLLQTKKDVFERCETQLRDCNFRFF